MTRIEKSIGVKASAEVIFAYMDDIRNRGQHMLGMGKSWHFEILSPNPTGVEATYRWSGRTYGWKFDWTEIVTEWVKNERKTQHSIKGMKIDSGWIVSTNVSESNLTIWMEYEIGYSLLGRLVDLLYARRFCTKGIEKDLQHTKEFLETAEHAGSSKVETPLHLQT